MNRRVSIVRESWPLAKPFVISRGSRTETEVIKVEIADGAHVGMGEGAPSRRYGESATEVVQQIEGIRTALTDGATREELLDLLPPGSARNAVDAALWDLQSKVEQQGVGVLTGLGWPQQIETAQTLSLDSVEETGKAAFELRNFPVIKIKLDQLDVVAKVRAVQESAPNATLLIDANESWTFDFLCSVAPDLHALGVAMIEQPMRADDDEALSAYEVPLPLYADESCHTRPDLGALRGKYQGVNIKLDKTGGLTEALALLHESKRQGFEVMVGCMLSTSLGIAPALFVAQHARWIDLDAPALLKNDRTPGLSYVNGRIETLPESFWGGCLTPS